MSLLGISKKGKWIVGGICAFAIVATASTGLATWVIGQNSGDETNGQLTAASVNDANIVISNLNFGSSKIVFGPKSNDTTGLVYYDGKSGVTESLTAKLTGKITYGASADFDSLQYTFAIDETSSKTAKDAYSYAITNHYIVAPAAEVKDPFSKEVGGATDASFEHTISFAWGTAFGGDNPGEYFDNSKPGDGTVTKDYATAKAVLTKLAEINELKFKVTVKAVKTPASSN